MGIRGFDQSQAAHCDYKNSAMTSEEDNLQLTEDIGILICFVFWREGIVLVFEEISR